MIPWLASMFDDTVFVFGVSWIAFLAVTVAFVYLHALPLFLAYPSPVPV